MAEKLEKRITVEEVAKIRELKKQGIKQNVIARQMGVSEATVCYWLSTERRSKTSKYNSLRLLINQNSRKQIIELLEELEGKKIIKDWKLAGDKWEWTFC